MKENYQLKLDNIIKEECADHIPHILMHACCAPCSSYVLEYLSEYFELTLYFYNPNISDESEYFKRAQELERLIGEMQFKNEVHLIIEDYDPSPFTDASKGLEDAPEKGARCEKCFYLRLLKTAELASKGNFDYYCTTLTISPHKNAQLINTLGETIGEKLGIKFLPSDFKKKEGFKRSTQLSIEHGLYRQNYCGCIFSKTASK